MATRVPVLGKTHSPSQYDRSGALEMYMNSKLPKSGSAMRGGENLSFRLWNTPIRLHRTIRLRHAGPMRPHSDPKPRAGVASGRIVRRCFHISNPNSWADKIPAMRVLLPTPPTE